MTQVRRKISLEEFTRLFPYANLILKDLGQDGVVVLLEITPLAYEQYNPKTKQDDIIIYNET